MARYPIKKISHVGNKGLHQIIAKYADLNANKSPIVAANIAAAGVRVIPSGMKAIIAKNAPIISITLLTFTSAPIALRYAPAEANDAVSIQPYPNMANGPNQARIASASKRFTENYSVI